MPTPLKRAISLLPWGTGTALRRAWQAVFGPAYAGHRFPRGTRIARTPLRGASSARIERIDYVAPDGTRTTFVEKRVVSGGDDARFWSSPLGRSLTTRGDTYVAISPLDIRTSGPRTVLTFPYSAEIDCAPSEATQRYRDHIDRIIVAAAEFNGRNRVDPGPHERPLPLIEPTVTQLQHRLNLAPDMATELRDRWRVAREAWEQVDAAAGLAPHTVVRSDLHHANVASVDGTILLYDFGAAGVAPVGWDLHVVFRQLRAMRAPDAQFARAVAMYTETIQCFLPDVTERDVLAGAWAAAFPRYTNPGRRDGRNLGLIRWVLKRVEEVAAELDAADPPLSGARAAQLRGR